MRKSPNRFERNKNNSQGDLVCGRLNCSESSGVNPLVRRVMRICFGSKPLSLAVRIIVEIRDTFLVPWSERLPKVIFLKITRFLKLLSALLFVGSTTLGYLRKVSISSLLWNIARRISFGIKLFKRSLLSLSKILFKRVLFLSKLAYLFFKFSNFTFSKTKKILHLINPLAEIISFSKHFGSGFSVKIMYLSRVVKKFLISI